MRYCSDCGAEAREDLDRCPECDVLLAGDDEPERGLIPEIVEEPDVELISRRHTASVPEDAPAPPPPGDDPARLRGDPYPTSLPISMEREEPPVSMSSPLRDRLAARGAGMPDEDLPSMLPAVAAGSRATPAVVEAKSAGSEPLPSLYRDPRRAAVVARAGLWLVAAFTAAGAVGLYLLNDRIDGLDAGTATAAEVLSAETLVNGRLRPALGAVAVLALLFLMRWSATTYHNVRAFGKTDLRVRPGAAALAWLIPGVNLVVAPLVMNDAWRAADVYARDDPHWRKRRGNRWTGLAVVLLLAAGGSVVMSMAGGRATSAAAMAANQWLMIASGALVLACLALTRAVSSITHRQQTRLHVIRNLG
jgi:hypothetical protein